MNVEKILSMVDHTLLAQDATWEDIRQIIDDGITYRCASVCIPAAYVKKAAQYAGGKVKICTVIGFPNGYSTTAAKCFEAADAVKNGADEVDMVINIGFLKDGLYDAVLEEINRIKAACDGKLLMCEIVSASDADFIKTSTGFSKAGATKEDIRLFAAHMTGGKKIKAAGGISSLEDAEAFIALGAERLGTSRIVKIIKNTGGNDNGTY